jgi:hypothetical protein
MNVWNVEEIFLYFYSQFSYSRFSFFSVMCRKAIIDLGKISCRHFDELISSSLCTKHHKKYIVELLKTPSSPLVCEDHDTHQFLINFQWNVIHISCSLAGYKSATSSTWLVCILNEIAQSGKRRAKRNSRNRAEDLLFLAYLTHSFARSMLLYYYIYHISTFNHQKFFHENPLFHNIAKIM